MNTEEREDNYMRIKCVQLSGYFYKSTGADSFEHKFPVTLPTRLISPPKTILTCPLEYLLPCCYQPETGNVSVPEKKWFHCKWTFLSYTRDAEITCNNNF